MSNLGQTILIRTDLFDMDQDVGLISAQVAHIHMELMRKMFFDNSIVDDKGIHCHVKDLNTSRMSGFKENLLSWLDCPYIFVKQVPNAEALKHFYELAIEYELPVNEWKDTVYVRLSKTMKQAFPNTLVGISIGPADADAIRTVVGDLPLL